MHKLTNVHFLCSCFLVRGTVKRIFLFGVYCTRVSKQVEPKDWILLFSFLSFFLSPPYSTFPSLLNCRCCLKTRTWGWSERNREPLWIDRLRKRMRTTEGKIRKKRTTFLDVLILTRCFSLSSTRTLCFNRSLGRKQYILTETKVAAV